MDGVQLIAGGVLADLGQHRALRQPSRAARVLEEQDVVALEFDRREFETGAFSQHFLETDDGSQARVRWRARRRNAGDISHIETA